MHPKGFIYQLLIHNYHQVTNKRRKREFGILEKMVKFGGITSSWPNHTVFWCFFPHHYLRIAVRRVTKGSNEMIYWHLFLCTYLTKRFGVCWSI